MSSSRSRFQQFKAAKQKNAASNSLAAILKQARKSGVLNLSNQGFEVVPESVWTMHEPPEAEARSQAEFGSGDRWWEQADLRKLYLSSNKLKSLSESIDKFLSLQVLDLQDNQLTELPACIGQLENLENLNVSHNQLSKIDFEFSRADSLGVLIMMHNKITEICPGLFTTLRNCQQINLSHNKLAGLPTTVGHLSNIRHFNLSNNLLVQLPMDIGKLQSIKLLDLSNNLLETLPDSTNTLLKLEQLYLRNNRLTSFPDISACTSLKELCLGSNQLKLVPPSLPRSLSILELRENKIGVLNEEVLNIEMLERLDLANNDLSQIAPQISIMPNLKVITLEGNPIKSIRRDVINRGSAAILKFLQTRIPEDAPTLQTQQSALPQSQSNHELTKNHEIASSKKLNIKDSDADKIDNELAELKDVGLVDVMITKCKLVDVPVGLSAYQDSLTKLSLSHNRISSLTVIPELVSLTHLDLSCNMLTELPEDFHKLQSLMEINIVANRFPQIPGCLYQITSLEHILADENQITSIDVESLKSLSSLSILSLKNNNINNVPPELGNLEHLKTLSIEGNLFRVPRQAILKKGTVAILEYLRSRIVQ